jgi:hypothetical protein
MNLEDFSQVFSLRNFKDFEHNLDETCCVCFENINKFKDGICLPCCKHMIHPCCLIKSLLKTSIKCPLCRCGDELVVNLSQINKILLATLVKLSIEIVIIKEFRNEKNIHKTFETNMKIILERISTFYNNIEEDFMKYLYIEFNYKTNQLVNKNK